MHFGQGQEVADAASSVVLAGGGHAADHWVKLCASSSVMGPWFSSNVIADHFVDFQFGAVAVLLL